MEQPKVVVSKISKVVIDKFYFEILDDFGFDKSKVVTWQ